MATGLASSRPNHGSCLGGYHAGPKGVALSKDVIRGHLSIHNGILFGMFKQTGTFTRLNVLSG